jgi:Carbohydrate esterase, sialic acid-specific acetylesterase
VIRGVLIAMVAAGAVACAPHSAPSDAGGDRQLFVLAGQSNMAGRGVVEADDRVSHPRVEMLTRDLVWAPAVDPVHFDKPAAGVGPGRAFGLAIAAHDGSAQVGLVPTAVGGSPISAWRPGALYAETGTHPYDDALARVRVAQRSGRVRAVLWHQGESDATPALSVAYADRLRELIARFRADLGEPDLPFLIGQLGQFEGAPWSAAKVRVDSAQRAVAASMHNVAFVTAEGLVDKGDTLHFDARSARELGRRYAAAYERMVER